MIVLSHKICSHHFARKGKNRIFAQFLYDGKWYNVYIVFIIVFI